MPSNRKRRGWRPTLVKSRAQLQHVRSMVLTQLAAHVARDWAGEGVCTSAMTSASLQPVGAFDLPGRWRSTCFGDILAAVSEA